MKKLFLPATAVFFLLAACNNPNTNSNTSSSDSTKMSSNANNSQEAKEERNKQTALASIQAYTSYNTDAILKDADKDAVEYGDGTMKPVKGLDSIKAGMQRMLPAWKAAFPDFKAQDLVAVADSNYVMIWGKYSGTWKGDFMGMKPSGKSFHVDDVDIFKFNDAGKITEHRSVQSNQTIYNQIGMRMPTP